MRNQASTSRVKGNFGLKECLARGSQSNATLLVGTHDLVGNAFDADQAARRLMSDASDVAEVLKFWRKSLERKLACLPAMICQRTRAMRAGAVGRNLKGERFSYIRVDECQVSQDDIRRVSVSLGLKAAVQPSLGEVV